MIAFQLCYDPHGYSFIQLLITNADDRAYGIIVSSIFLKMETLE